MLTVTNTTFLYEDSEAWVKFTRLPDGAVAVDSYLEAVIPDRYLCGLAAWLRKAEAPHA